MKNKQTIIFKMLFIATAVILMGLSACKTSTTPQPADCDLGYHQCEYDESICCVDTTSHNFTWTIDIIGVFSAVLTDVSIISENDIWVIGDIYTNDTGYLKNENVAHWDGSEWTISSIEFLRSNGEHYSSVGECVKAFSTNDVWFVSSYGALTHFDGSDYQYYGFGSDQRFKNEIWGNSSDYFVLAGDSTIVHYNGNEFIQYAPITNSSIYDLYGLDQNNIWAVSYNDALLSSYDNLVIHFDGQNWNELYRLNTEVLYPDSISGIVEAIWASGDTVYIPSSAGIWKKSINGNGVLMRPQEMIDEGINYFTGTLIRGNNANDYFYGYWNGQIFHYNGIDWYYIPELAELQFTDPIRLFKMAQKDNVVVFVGEQFSSGLGIIIKGVRY